MKRLYILLIIAFCFAAGLQAQAQTNKGTPILSQEQKDRLMLNQADSVFRMHDARAAQTNRELKEAKRELDIAQDKYDEAKRRDKEASNAAKQAKKSYKMEKKAQKARKKAEDQANKAEKAAAVSNQFN